MSRRWTLLVTLGCFLAGAFSLLRADQDDLKSDVALLKGAGVKTETEALLDFFKKRTVSEEVRLKVEGLIEQLGADEFAIREKATADLIALQGLCRSQVTRALQATDLEVRRRARLILNKIGPASTEAALLGAAARVLTSRRSEESSKVLLAFLPWIEDPDVAEEVARALVPVAMDPKGNPDRALVAALSDKLPLRRFAAGYAFAQTPRHRGLARKLLKDEDSGVRRRVAIALLEAKDKQAVPALIDLLTVSSVEDVAAAEDALYLVAGEKAPAPPAEDTEQAREKYQKDWEAWWKANAEKVDLAKIDLEGAIHGYTLLTVMETTKTTTGVVLELDAAGKERWRIANLNYPVYASMARRDRVLVCEYYGNRVTERDLKGRIIWSKNVTNQVLCAERLPNGNTFIATRNQLLEVDKEGKEVLTINRAFDVLGVHRQRDGKMALLTTNGNYVQLDAQGKQLSSFAIGYLGSTIGFRAHFLPKGGVVVPDYTRSKIREYDGSGKLLHEIDFTRPSAVVKLSNGNYLVASRLRNRIVEIDKTGKEISSRDTPGRPLYLDRR